MSILLLGYFRLYPPGAFADMLLHDLGADDDIDDIIIASIYFPNATFVATGGLQNMQPVKMHCLMGRDIILFPDLDATEKWIAKANEIPALKNAKVSTWLEKHSTPEEKLQGLDIGDYLVRLPAWRKLRLEDFI